MSSAWASALTKSEVTFSKILEQEREEEASIVKEVDETVLLMQNGGEESFKQPSLSPLFMISALLRKDEGGFEEVLLMLPGSQQPKRGDIN